MDGKNIGEDEPSIWMVPFEMFGDYLKENEVLSG